MKKMMSALLLTLGMSSPAWSQDVGVILGVRSDNADADTASVTISSKTGYQVGVTSQFELAEPLRIRSGLIYNARSYGYSTTPALSSDGEIKLTYFEIPVGLLYKFSDFGGAFVGAAVNLNLAKDCPGGSCNGMDVNSSPLSVQLGGSFKVAPQFGFELYYEMVTGQLANELKSPRSIVANLMITFD